MSNIEHKMHTMLVIQNELNQVIDPSWQDRGFRFEDALAVEAVELFDHLPWKWWKKQTKPVDWAQVKLEAIDIWHFIMSRLIQMYGIEKAVEALAKEFGSFAVNAEGEPDWETVAGWTRELLQDVAEENAGVTPKSTPFYLRSFHRLLASLGMTVDELYTIYVGKTQLNRLRWANGYGDTYIKIWDGQEDNVWLAEYAKMLDVNAPDFKDQVYAGLVGKYALVKEQARAAERVTMEACNGR